MSFIEDTLPWARGDTFLAGETTGDDTSGQSFEGRLFRVADTLHSGTKPVILRVVKNDSASRLSGVDRQCLSFRTDDPSDWGCRVDGIAGTAGEICKPVDDYYKHVGVTGFAAYDLFYVVDEGLCNVMTTTEASMTATPGQAVHMAGNGKIGVASAADTTIGSATIPLTTATSTACTIEVRAGVITDAP